MMNHNVLTEVLVASKQWVKHFNNGDVDYCVSAYLPEAELIAKPMGTFDTHESIDHFWRPFVQSGATDLEYHQIWLKQINDTTVQLGADWTMNMGKGVISLEEWVKTEAGIWKLAQDQFEIAEQY
ncbi:MAG: YybH family protein [Endozoicomonas sp.]|uniref:YybH family protein n=1 Tax=Endozoicomonas sp. TaxID=1892382 RepID=UPI003D9BB3D5